MLVACEHSRMHEAEPSLKVRTKVRTSVGFYFRPSHQFPSFFRVLSDHQSSYEKAGGWLERSWQVGKPGKLASGVLISPPPTRRRRRKRLEERANCATKKTSSILSLSLRNFRGFFLLEKMAIIIFFFFKPMIGVSLACSTATAVRIGKYDTTS